MQRSNQYARLIAVWTEKNTKLTCPGAKQSWKLESSLYLTEQKRCRNVTWDRGCCVKN